MSVARTKSPRKLLAVQVVLAGLLAAGCNGPAATQPIDEEQFSLKRGLDGAQLINEGGPVFAMPGEVVLPSYYTGPRDNLRVVAEQPYGDGAQVLSIQPVATDGNGAFTLRVPRTSKDVFFATAIVTHEDRLHRVRTLVRPADGQKITIDTASTLVSAKIMLASSRQKKAELNGLYDQTAALVHEVRQEVAPADIRAIWIDRPNGALSTALTELAATRPNLYPKLLDWERALYRDDAPKPAAPTSSQPAAETPPDPGTLPK